MKSAWFKKKKSDTFKSCNTFKWAQHLYFICASLFLHIKNVTDKSPEYMFVNGRETFFGPKLNVPEPVG